MAVALAVLAGVPYNAAAQGIRGIVVDQTGLPLPGATLQLLDRTVVTATLTTGPDGTFVIDNALEGSTIVVSLDGFEHATVPRSEASRIVLEVAHTAETTDVVAPSLTTNSPTTPLLGNTLTAATVARLPSSRMRARESLPLLPSVMRGPDGLLQVGGARPHESPLLLDGFDVTDPATGTTSINLPFEAVRGIEVRRDPMGITYGGLLGSSKELWQVLGSAQYRRPDLS